MNNNLVAAQMIADSKLPRFFYMHIPKAAGTSVNDFFAAVFGQPACAFHLESHPEVVSGLNLPAYDSIQVASGHMRFPHIKSVLVGSDWRVVTCLRNPVEHLLSHLRWVKHIGSPGSEVIRARHSLEIQEMSLRLYEISLDDIGSIERFIFFEHAEALQLFDNCQTRYLIAHQEDRIGVKHSDLAFKSLADVDFVFAMEQAARALPAMLRALGPRQEQLPEFPRSNRGPHKEAVDLNDGRVRDFYRELVMFDARLFIEARRRGEALLEQTVSHAV